MNNELSTTPNSLTDLVELHGKEAIMQSLKESLGYTHGTNIPTIDEFIESNYYIGITTRGGEGIYGFWREKLRLIFPNPFIIKYESVFLRGAIGTGKSTIGYIMFLYILARLILMNNPHKFFGLLGNKSLAGFLYSVKKDNINSALVGPIWEIIEVSPFFKENLIGGGRFTNKLEILSGSRIASNVGLDVPVAILDEIQLEIIGGQVKSNYNSLKKRIQSRFMLSGGIYFNALIILVGSAGGISSFSEELTVKSKTNNKILVIDPPQWEVLSTGKITYSGKTFTLFIGNETTNPKILYDELEIVEFTSKYPDDIMTVPKEYIKDFEDDIYQSLQDIAGITTRNEYSYYTNIEKLNGAFTLVNLFKSSSGIFKLPFFNTTSVMDFMIPNWTKKLLNPSAPRYLGIDLGVVGDRTGITMCHIAGFVDSVITDTRTRNVSSSLEPWIVVDFSIGISRNPGEETSITKIKNFIIDLKAEGINLKEIAVDGFQSRNLIQDLNLLNYPIKRRPLSGQKEVHDLLREIIYSDRINIVNNKELRYEMKNLIVTNSGRKVDHQNFSHDDITTSLLQSVRSALDHRSTLQNPLNSFSDASLHKEINHANKDTKRSSNSDPDEGLDLDYIFNF